MSNQRIEKACIQREPEKHWYDVVITTDEFRAWVATATDDSLADYIYSQAVELTCRTGKTSKWRTKWENRTVKRGNPVTLSEVVEMLAQVGERIGGKPSKEDVEKRDNQWLFKREALKKEFPDDTPTQEAQRLDEWARSVDKKNASKYADDWAFTWDDDATARDNFLGIVRANRRAIERIAARQAKKGSDDDLS